MDEQIFIQSPNFKTLVLNLNPSHPQTLGSLKQSIFSDRIHCLSDFYFTFDGKPLTDSTSIPNPQIGPFSTLFLRYRVSGGGGDGGATGAESRDCYLNMYAEKKPDKVDRNEQRLSKWLNCALSYEPLSDPCVIDRLGKVFNKQALVEALLEKKLPKEFGYIKGLKDMINIKLSPNPCDDGEARFQCPISGLEFNGNYKFFALRNCGHVLSAKALKEVKSSACLVCHEEFKETDMFAINGSEEEIEILRERMNGEMVKTKDKKPKKVKNGGDLMSVTVGLDSGPISRAKREIDEIHDDKKTLKISGKVVGNGKIDKDAVAVKRLKKAVAVAPANANKEVYASIFTSSRKSDFKETYSCRSLPLGRN